MEDTGLPGGLPPLVIPLETAGGLLFLTVGGAGPWPLSRASRGASENE